MYTLGYPWHATLWHCKNKKDTFSHVDVPVPINFAGPIVRSLPTDSHSNVWAELMSHDLSSLSCVYISHSAGCGARVLPWKEEEEEEKVTASHHFLQ